MVQTIRPASTISSGSWAAQGAASLHEATDEASQDGDTTRAEAASGAGTFEVKLGSASDPSSAVNHTVYLWGKGVGSGAGEKVDVFLYESTTLIATLANNWTPGRSAYAELSYTLSAGEANAIGDYADLRVRVVEDTIGGGSERFNVTQIYMEIPDAAVIHEGAVAIAGSGAVTVSGGLVHEGGVNISGSAAVTSLGDLTLGGALAIAGSGEVVASGVGIFVGSTSTPGTAEVVAAGERIVSGAVNIAGSGEITAVGGLVITGAAAISGSGEVTAAGEKILSGAVSISGTAETTAAGEVVAPGGVTHEGAAVLTGSALIAVLAGILKTGAVEAPGSATVTVSAHRTQTGQVSIKGGAEITVFPVAILVGAISIRGTGYAIWENDVPDNFGEITRGTFKAVVNREDRKG